MIVSDIMTHELHNFVEGISVLNYSCYRNGKKFISVIIATAAKRIKYFLKTELTG